MNKLYKWCLLSCMAATLSSCNDFLTEENPSGLTADTFYKTESGAEALINSCYTPLRFWYGQEYATSMTELGTDIFTRGNGCAEAELSDYNSSLQGSSNAKLKSGNVCIRHLILVTLPRTVCLALNFQLRLKISVWGKPISCGLFIYGIL